MAAPTGGVMQNITALARGLIFHSMEYVRNKILTLGNDSRCLGEIQQFESLLWTVSSVFSVSSVNKVEK